MSEYKGVCVAKIIKLFGLDGAVVIEPLTDIKERIYKSKDFFLDEDCNEKIEVEKIEGDWYHLHIFFKKYKNIDESRCLVGKFLFLPRTESFDIEENELFYYQIFEYKIEYLPDNFTYASDIYFSNNLLYISIKIDNKEFLIPFVKDFIDKIDKENHIIKLKRFELIQPNNIR